jgi:hypothetical protein
MSDQVLLRDLVSIPDEVHAGDFVLALSQGVGKKSTITDYVVTEQLAENFDKALGLIRSALEGNASRAAYLDGSFGSGKSHFMAVLHAILRGDPDARGKKGLADVVAKHDPWLRGRRFLLVPYHLPDSQSLDQAILGGYVAHVSKYEPGKPLPAVYIDDQLLEDAKELRNSGGDDRFIAQLPATDPEWGTAWDTVSLDAAFAQPPDGEDRRRLVGDLLAGPFHRYARAVRAEEESYINLDEGLSVISKHARDVLGYDAIVLLLDELVLWLAGYIGTPARVSQEAQKVSKLVESAEHERPAPIVSFVPRQRDLRDLVRKDALGTETTSLFDTLKYWDGRFDQIRLDDRNLPAIVHERLLKPKDAAAERALDDAFKKAASVPPQTWETLLDAHGDKGDRDSFRLTYPFSPAFVHAMVDISGALQRQRTALKLMQQLLVDYRDTLPVGQLMPLGAIFDVLARGTDRPFTDQLRDEFEKARSFYTSRVRPYLLGKYGLTEDQAQHLSSGHQFRADDLVVKTLLLAALVPNVPALNGLTASRLAALNHGSIITMLPNQERSTVTRTVKDLAANFGEVHVSGSESDPRVDLALIGVDTESILRGFAHADDEAARRKLLRDLLWDELKLADEGTFDTQTKVIWHGTSRVVDVLLDNVRDAERVPSNRFGADPGTIRVVFDYPVDEATFSPQDDINRVHELQNQLEDEDTLIWLANFLSEARRSDLSSLVRINYALERDRLAEATPNLTADERYQARTQLESRRGALIGKLREALRRAYGVSSPDDADLGARAEVHVLSLVQGLKPLRIDVGLGLRAALERLCFTVLDHRYPSHPDFDQNGRGQELRISELETVVRAVDEATKDKVGRYEPPRADIATVKKIANPLKIGVMHEASFVLGHDWPQLIGRHAAGLDEVPVSKVRGWVADEQPGLPDAVRDLIIVCYALATDKAWRRAGQPIEMPALTRITDDMVLLGQELPTSDEFERASRRAEGIFEVKREPVRTARSVQALAQSIRQKAATALPDVESLDEELDKHHMALGLDDDQPRMATSRIVTALLKQLANISDPTDSLRVLASAGLPCENAIYKAHIDSARALAGDLRGRNWRVLDDLAISGDPEGRVILAPLRDAARRDEHEAALGAPLRRADKEALDLVLSRQKQQNPPAPPPQDAQTRRVRASEVASVVEEICEAADSNQDAEFEITWRVVRG